MKISSRLGWGFGILLILLMVVGLLGLFEVNRISQINRALYEHPFTVSNATQRLETNAVRMQVALERMLLAGELKDLQKQIELLKETHRQVAADLETVNRQYLGPRRDVARARTSFDRWMGLHRQVAGLLAAGDRRQAVVLLDQFNQSQAEKSQRAAEVLRAYAYNKAEEYLEQSQESLTVAKMVLAAAVVAAVLIAGLLTFWLIRSIMRPLGQVAALAENMAEGRPAAPVQYLARDELGRLAASLRALLSGLVGESRSLREHIPAVLWMADRELRLTFLNPQAVQLASALTGLPPDQIEGRLSVEQALPDREDLTSLLALDAMEHGLEREAEVDYLLNGRELHLQQVISPLRDLDGRVTGVMGVGLDISHRREMERALAESESQFRRAIMAAPQPIMIYAEGGKVIQVNQAWTRISGYPARQLDTVEHWTSLAYDKDGPRVSREVGELFGTLDGPQNQGEYTVRAADGRELVWEFSSAPLGSLPDGRRLMLSIASDVTQRKKAEAAIGAAEERFRTLVENVPGAVYRCSHDDQWTMVFVSEAIEEITGHPASDFIHNRVRSFESVVHPDDREAVRAEVEEALAQDRPFTMEYRALHAGGGLRWIFEKGSAVRDEQGGFLCLDGVMLDITEQKLAEQARQRSEALYTTLFERAGDGIFLMEAEGEQTGRIFSANRSAERSHGYGPGEMEGLNIRELVVKNVPGRLKQALAGEWLHFEVDHFRRDGSIFPLEVSVGLVELGGERFLVAMDRDISERRRAENERRERDIRFGEVFNNMSSGVAIYRPSPDGQKFIFQDINPAGLRMTGRSLDEVVGAEVREVFPSVEDMGLLDVFKRVWASGEPEHMPVTLYQDQAVSLWVENYVCKLPGGEVVAIYDDLTQVKNEEQERSRLENQLRQTQKLEALGTLAGGIAHDFNNILAAVMGYAELARDGVPASSPARDDIEQVMVASERARNLVRQILSFARRSQEPRSPMSLTPVVKETFKLLRATVPSTVEMKLSENLAADQVDADPVQMHQMIMNLCTNAAQAMEGRGGNLTLSMDRLELDPETAASYADLEPGAYMLLSVADDGPGIPAEIMGRIFEPFFTTKEPDQGTGMGLAVVHGIVQAHGGAVTVYSEPGQGTTFHVYLPVYTGATGRTRVEAVPEALKGSERVLFVDDEPALAELGRRILGGLGYQVEEFTSPREAWKAFAARPEDFDLVVSDYTMPKMTGRDLAAKITNLSPGTPVIICSGFNPQIDQEWLTRLGVSSLLNKPLVARELAEAIRRALDQAGPEE
ncbi:MAG: PAS domain S-box protein [Desulfarculaceae bacterium]|nr:PAS domain S-box protein [Desulfarculaceae bacterium]MCF8073566.1 PAS domain S-box protein [Desulfarculaceae bacterium]MCF8103088.1 PAS domain S-box protein [Desulfarculaceae bacterium]MCF8115718.1 PAS domain S-box protein [Desulfarculaceae bacterium]